MQTLEGARAVLMLLELRTYSASAKSDGVIEPHVLRKATVHPDPDSAFLLLESAGKVLKREDDGAWIVDWESQKTADDRQAQNEYWRISKRHQRGNHEQCPDHWQCRRGMSRKDTSKDKAQDSAPLSNRESQHKARKGKSRQDKVTERSEVNEVADADAQENLASPPSADAPVAAPEPPSPKPPSEAAPLPVDDEPLRPRTPIAEIDFENFDLHDVTARTQVSLYEVDDDGGCEVYTVLSRTEEVLSCDPDTPLYAQILAKVPERLAWIGEAIESKLTAAGLRFDAVTCFAEDPMDDWTITVEWCRVEDRVKLVEIIEEALQNAGLFPVADE
ncbi:hypothetical protein AWH04_13245 [Rhodococcus erythropolis]|nr:hypothetical protein AWH04_13245 [Rhodococcus erythropolis]